MNKKCMQVQLHQGPPPMKSWGQAEVSVALLSGTDCLDDVHHL